LALFLVISGAARADPLPSGDGEASAEIEGVKFDIFSYRPSCRVHSLLLVFAGLDRDADRYRDYARPLADKLCLLVLAPLFDKMRFPDWRYQKGGVVRAGVVQDPLQWPSQYVLGVVEWARNQEGEQLAYSLLGHSAGGQFLSRVAAFTPTAAQRIVIANPSTYVLASLDVKAPFGMGGVYPPDQAEAQLRRYLSAPISIFLGEDDEGAKNRDDSANALQQGATRYARGLATFHSAQELAQSRGWTFNWRLVTVPGVAHSAAKMFASPQALQALQ
jgi:hypothetical protein